MIRQFISPARVRSIVADAVTDTDIVAALRRHRVRYTYSTEGGALHVRIPCRGGAVRIYRSTEPFRPPFPRFPFPVLHPDRD